MPADMNVPYDRRYTDAKVNGLVRRAVATQSVLTALGSDAPDLPRYPAADYVAQSRELQMKETQINAKLTDLVALLREIDVLSDNVKAASEAYLPALRAATMGTANESLLAQITGPSTRGSSDSPPTPPHS